MKRMMTFAMATLVLAASAIAQAPAKAAPKAAAKTAAKTGPTSTAKILDDQLRQVESEFVPAADAMPEDKYDFAPTGSEFKDVRTFALQVRHVATVNYWIYAAIAGEKNPVDLGKTENGADTLQSKADIMKYLKDSYAFAHKALTSTPESRWKTEVPLPFAPKVKTTPLALAVLLQGHQFDHYGQMVEYLRMNGIVPPASRPRQQ